MATLKVSVDPARDHILGNIDAPLTLVEFGDYECPTCAKAQPVVEAVRDELGDDLRVVFRSFPLSEMHKHALHAAEAVLAAGEAGKFWEMHFAVFDAQKSGLEDDKLVAIAQSVGVSGARITEALGAGTYTGRVGEDKMGGIRSGVNATPTFFVNGTRHDDSWDVETLVAALRSP